MNDLRNTGDLIPALNDNNIINRFYMAMTYLMIIKVRVY